MAEGPISVPIDIKFRADIDSIVDTSSKVAKIMQKMSKEIDDALNSDSADPKALKTNEKLLTSAERVKKAANELKKELVKVGSSTKEYSQHQARLQSNLEKAKRAYDNATEAAKRYNIEQAKSKHQSELTDIGNKKSDIAKQMSYVEQIQKKLAPNGFVENPRSKGLYASLGKQMDGLNAKYRELRDREKEILAIAEKEGRAVDVSKNKDVQDAKKQVEQAQKNVDKDNTDPAVYATYGTPEQHEKIHKLQSKLALEYKKFRAETKIAKAQSDPEAQNAAQLEKEQKKLEQLEAKKAKLVTLKKPQGQVDNVQYDIDMAKQKIQELMGVQQQEEQEAPRPFEVMRQKVTEVKAALGEIAQDYANVWKSDNASEAVSRLKNVKQEVNSLLTSITGLSGATFDNAFKKMGQGIKNALGNLVKSTAQKAVSNLKKIANGFKNVGKHADKSGKGGIKRFFDYMKRYLLRRIIYQALQNLVQTFKASLKTMAQQMPEFNEQMSQFQTALNGVKGSMGTAFQPLLSAVLPILTRLCDMLRTAMNWIGKFNAALTGQGYIYEFTANKADYAAEGTKKAANEMKRSLAGFDEINTLGSDSSSDSGSDKGTLDGTYTKKAVDATNSWGEALRKGLFEKDWDMLYGKIDNITKKFNDFLDPEGFRTKAQNFGKEVSNLLTGLGGAAARFIQGIDWQKLATTLYNGIKGFLQGVDWAKVVSTAFSLLGSVLGASAGFIWSLMKNIWADVKAAFKKLKEKYIEPNIKKAGGNVIKGVWEGIKEALSDVGNWIKKNILEPFLKSFKKAFEIKSPSRVMKEQGGYIILGLFNGITEQWERFKNWWSEKKTKILETAKNVKTWIVNVFNDFGDKLKTKFSDAWTKVKNIFSSGGKVFTGIKEGIEKSFKTIVNKLIDGINAIIKKPFEKIRSMLDSIKSFKIGTIQPFKNLGTITIPSIPKLAKGSVVPPNKEFLAMLGDNKKETEIVSPLSTMKQALLEALQESGGFNKGIDNITIYLSTSDVTKAIVSQINSTTRQTGTCPVKLKV